MNLIEPKAEYIPQGYSLEDIYKKIEFCGRTCYKSEDKITDTSSTDFVNRMIKSGHGAMLEHGTIYLKCDDMGPDEYGHVNCIIPLKGNYSKNPYSKVNFVNWEQEPKKKKKEFCKVIPRTTLYITTNFRVIIENGWEEDLKYICEPTVFHEKRYTIKLTTDIGVTREGNRHRKNSIAEESTRYCNYTKEKFGGEIKVAKHAWFTDEDVDFLTSEDRDPIKDLENYFRIVLEEIRTEKTLMHPIDYWYFSMLVSNYNYNKLIETGWVAQQARTVLTLSTKSDIVYTAFASDWKHFFNLRLYGTTGKPHPDMLALAEKMKDEFEKNGVFDDIINGFKCQ